VSYSLVIAGDAHADIRLLQPWLQEELLDEIDILAANPPPVHFRERHKDIVYAFHRTRSGILHRVFVTVRYNARSNSLLILGVSHHPA